MKTFNLMTLTPNPSNPRLIRNDEYKRLLESIKRDPQFMEKNKIAYKDGIIFDGNQRYHACLEVTRDAGYRKKIGTQKEGEVPLSWMFDASAWTDKQCKRWAILANSPPGISGDWDMDVLANEWGDMDLNALGMEVPEEGPESETSKLSEMEYNSIYYEPECKPDINLVDCVDLSKYDAKMAALDEYDLTEEQKETLSLFAYRFIKIDFESVANYYAFHATEEEQKAMERLRLVLVDGAINGFIEDDMLRTMEQINMCAFDEDSSDD